MVYEKFTYSEAEKARMNVQREENLKDFLMTVKELHNCIEVNEWPDIKLLQSFYQTSQKIKWWNSNTILAVVSKNF